MKKIIALVLVLMLVVGLVACNSSKLDSDNSGNDATETQDGQKTTEQKQDEQNAKASDANQTPATGGAESAVIAPLPVTIDLAKLEDCTLAISLEKGGVYEDETGAVVMDVTVFVYDLYDMVDISLMQEGDTILIGQKEILISSIEHKEGGLISINGGLDNGGFDLCTDENTVYYEWGYNDTKAYYELGKVSIPVSPDFVYEDASELDADAKIFHAEDFLGDSADIEYYFNANDTTIQIENGYVTMMTRVYAP